MSSQTAQVAATSATTAAISVPVVMEAQPGSGDDNLVPPPLPFRALQLKMDYEQYVYTDEDVVKRMKRIATGRGAGRPDFETLDAL